MIKRWLICLVSFLPLICVVGAWVASCFGMPFLDKQSGGVFRGVFVADGQVGAIQEFNTAAAGPFEFTFERTRIPSILLKSRMGFYISPLKYSPGYVVVIFPLWLPTLLLVALNWFVWRRARQKPAGRAFPLEPATNREA